MIWINVNFLQNKQIENQMYLRVIALIILLWSASAHSQASLQFFEYCSYHGYPVQDHIVPTEDHYNLQFYRIQAKNTKFTEGKRTVYFQHGLVDSADTWVVNDQSLSPAFYLANEGFDVWLGNSRGNRYSHRGLSHSVKDFWDFTFQDMAMYDLPAAFRYIARVTGRKIHYIGHSQGTLIMFIALAQKLKDVQNNLLSVHLFGPVTYMKHQKCKILKALSSANLPNILLKSHIKVLLTLKQSGLMINSDICKVAPIICKTMLIEISEMNNTVNNVKRLPTIMGHFPSGSSTKNFIHWGQYVEKEEFKQFDYGSKKNMLIYGQKTAPLYDLSKITIPVHLYVGKYDKLADVEDAARLFSQLKNSAGKTMKVYQFGHATFVWGKSLIHMIDTLKVINEAEPIQMGNSPQ